MGLHARFFNRLSEKTQTKSRDVPTEPDLSAPKEHPNCFYFRPSSDPGPFREAGAMPGGVA